ncbi:MAG: DUF4058 family protein [Planctomycetes bacterium]|nr:DUF4058 family protein [Planctomycetota bacterium]
MPIHDWTRVGPSTFHDLHNAWIIELRNVLNSGLLPPQYYAQSEQHTGTAIADVLTREHTEPRAETRDRPAGVSDSGLALLEAPPKTSVMETAGGPACYANRRRTLALRHESGDEMVARIEILSPGNKLGRGKLEDFVHKACEALCHGIHLLLIDLFPPGTFDPNGIHGELHRELGLETELGRWPMPGKPLTLAGYDASEPRAYVEPVAVGDALVDMPVFLKPGRYVNVPLEQTYRAAYRGVPQRWRSVIEAD